MLNHIRLKAKLSLTQIFDADILEVNFRAMTQKTNVACLTFQTWVVLFIKRAIFSSLSQVSLKNDSSVQRNLYVVAFDIDFLLVPLTHWLQMPPLGRHDAVYRSVILEFFKILIHIGIIIQNLDLHTLVSCIAFKR